MSIADIVQQQGWNYFRQLESQILASIEPQDAIISTGGGIILAPENQQVMRENGTVIYLRSTPETLVKRLAAEPQADQRPSLTGKSLLEEIEEVMTQRDPIYLSTAHHVIDANQSIDAIIKQIANLR